MLEQLEEFLLQNQVSVYLQEHPIRLRDATESNVI